MALERHSNDLVIIIRWVPFRDKLIGANSITMMSNKMHTIEEMILSVADGSLSVSRIRTIIKARYAIVVDVSEIKAITCRHNIDTPLKAPVTFESVLGSRGEVIGFHKIVNGVRGDAILSFDNYAVEYSIVKCPDKWTIFLTSRSNWTRVRRYWGDGAAAALKSQIESCDELHFTSILSQLADYTTAAIHERRVIDFNMVAPTLDELKSEFITDTNNRDLAEEIGFRLRFDWGFVRSIVLDAYDQEFMVAPTPQPGVRFPLPTPEYHAVREKEFIEAATLVANDHYPTEKELIADFVPWWQEIRSVRGQDFTERLMFDLSGMGNNGYNPTNAFYTATERNFRHFLSVMNRMKKRGCPPRIPFEGVANPRLPMKLEGALHKFGWKSVVSCFLWASLSE